jgi:LysR family glycine cleavage system transcriptional activator
VIACSTIAVGKRHQHQEHADQDHPAGHAEQARQEGRRDHQRTEGCDHQGRQENLLLKPGQVEKRPPHRFNLLFLCILVPQLVTRAQTELSCPGISFPEGIVRRLLFLNGIKAFEAAARTGSFAAAGAELNVSAAAVSRMVHLLEERLGVALFERKANRLATTAAGRAYQSGLTPIFDALASLTAPGHRPCKRARADIGVGPTFAMKWLIPRLADFRKHEPDIDVRITTGGAAVPFGEDWSCGIKLGDGEWPGLIAEPLIRRRPAAGLRAAPCQHAQRPGDLKGPTLLRVAHSPDDWPSWLEAAGTARSPPAGRNSSFTARRCRPPSTASASPWASAPISTTTSRRPAGRAVSR